ncbi:hypothetical protein DIPPA_06704 [Diplonema papillatum]|nr:hypothetical protein DIPPA_06704 [Diplonema papillatum]
MTTAAAAPTRVEDGWMVVDLKNDQVSCRDAAAANKRNKQKPGPGQWLQVRGSRPAPVAPSPVTADAAMSALKSDTIYNTLEQARSRKQAKRKEARDEEAASEDGLESGFFIPGFLTRMLAF